MDFFLIYVVIAVIAIFLFNVIFKPKFECPECETIHTKRDAKSQKATSIRYRHTRKDGNRDRRFNQSGTQYYDLTFECKNCDKMFIEDYGGIIQNYVSRRQNTLAKELLKKDPKIGKNLEALAKSFKELEDELDSR